MKFLDFNVFWSFVPDNDIFCHALYTLHYLFSVSSLRVDLDLSGRSYVLMSWAHCYSHFTFRISKRQVGIEGILLDEFNQILMLAYADDIISPDSKTEQAGFLLRKSCNDPSNLNLQSIFFCQRCACTVKLGSTSRVVMFSLKIGLHDEPFRYSKHVLITESAIKPLQNILTLYIYRRGKSYTSSICRRLFLTGSWQVEPHNYGDGGLWGGLRSVKNLFRKNFGYQSQYHQLNFPYSQCDSYMYPDVLLGKARSAS